MSYILALVEEVSFHMPYIGIHQHCYNYTKVVNGKLDLLISSISLCVPFIKNLYIEQNNVTFLFIVTIEM